MTGLERDTLYALKGIHEQLRRLADQHEEREDKADDRAEMLRKAVYDCSEAIYETCRRTK